MVESSSLGLDRRALIKKAGLAAGAVWVAPVVFSTTAGAATETCYFGKFDIPGIGGGCNSSDGSNGHCLNSFTTVSACGHPTLLSFTISASSVTANVAVGCDLKEIHLKAGNDCNIVAVSGTSATVSQASAPGGKDISHASVIYCCTDSSV